MKDRLERAVFLVEDDASLRDAMGRLLAEAGYRVLPFASAEAFLEAPEPDGCSCLLLDVRLPGLSGPALQRHLLTKAAARFIVFMTGHGDVPVAVEAMKKGAVDFLLKPVDEDVLIAAVEKALGLCRQEMERREGRASAGHYLAQLTPREKDVMLLVIEGLPNKIIANNLGIALQTVKIHRGRVMAKLQVESVVDLIHLAKQAGIGTPQSLPAESGAE